MNLGKVLGMAGLTILPFAGMSQDSSDNKFSIDKNSEKYIELSDSVRKYAGKGYSNYIIEKCLPKYMDYNRDSLEKVIKETDKYSGDGMYGYSLIQDTDFIRELRGKAEHNAPTVFRQTLPVYLESGLSKKEMLDITEKVQKMGFSAQLFNSILPAALEKNNNFKEIEDGLKIAHEYSSSTEANHITSKTLSELNPDYTEINDRVTFGKEIGKELNESKEPYKYVSIIDAIHDIELEKHSTDKARNKLAEETDFETKYKIISKAFDDIYPSTFDTLYKKMPENLTEEIKKTDPEGDLWTEFCINLGKAGKLENIVENDFDFFENSIKKGLKDTSNLITNGVFTVGSVLKYYDEGISKELENFLLKQYKNSSDLEQEGVYGYLLKLDKNPSEKVKEMTKDLPEIVPPKLSKEFSKKDTLAAKLYFGEEEGWFDITANQLNNNYGMEIIKQGDREITLGKKINGKDVLMTLSYNTREVGSDLSNPNVVMVGHRWHSHKEDYMYNYGSDENKIIYMGSCNSYSRIYKLKQHYPNSYIITNKGTGKGTENTETNYKIMENIAKNKREWDEIGKNIPEGIVLPNNPEMLMLSYINRLKRLYGDSN
ncbi:MAG: hypothetical protein ACOCP4_03785 [Candidatus Woesearchaeota archaeon]